VERLDEVKEKSGKLPHTVLENATHSHWRWCRKVCLKGTQHWADPCAGGGM